MKVTTAIAEIVSEFSGFQHLRTSKSTTSLSSMTSSVSRKASTSSEPPRHNLNIPVGVAPITKSNSSQSLQRNNSSISYLVVE
ncbi:hypothetical protein GCK72_019924 [Caenorhabditis remanei]|uniref:Uncharacterized protein n=1 Tax=Caenorhabditis remanei TaxID=31234 RepID=A0A6A5GE04_CAERE|nr:hypothetical protein GCK72_019924 [Caenorhabditis remanei]KAF1753368.1 hypothetical protein GCK72_019924 [Caenorhabditis remanei]